MLLSLLQFFATKFLVLALHLEAGSFPKPLTAREEIETFAALRAGDGSAREKLIRHNLRLVAHVAKKYYAQPRRPRRFNLHRHHRPDEGGRHFLRRYREAKGWNRQQLADHAKVSRTSIRCWESGQKTISQKCFCHLVENLSSDFPSMLRM